MNTKKLEQITHLINKFNGISYKFDHVNVQDINDSIIDNFLSSLYVDESVIKHEIKNYVLNITKSDIKLLRELCIKYNKLQTYNMLYFIDYTYMTFNHEFENIDIYDSIIPYSIVLNHRKTLTKLK